MQKIGLFLFALLSISPLALAQSTPAPTPDIQTVTLGNSAVALTGPWKFQPGDSPIVNGSPLYAQPAFNDTLWAPMDLTPQTGAVDLLLGTSSFVPGWTRKGYPNLTGFAWYRLRLRVNDPSQPLWIKMPANVDDAYQLYANGRLIGHFGDFSPTRVYHYVSRPLSFPLPALGPNGVLDLAVRFYLNPSTQFDSIDIGGMHNPPTLGLASTIHLLQASEDDARLHSRFGMCLTIFLLLLMTPLALWAWLYNPQERVWLWLSLALLWSLFIASLIVIDFMTNLLHIATVEWMTFIALPVWPIFWWYWFDLRQMRWFPRAAWALFGLISLLHFCIISPLLGFSLFSPSSLHGFYIASLLTSIPVDVLFIIILVEGFRHDRTEALLSAAPILLGMYGTLGVYLLFAFHVPNTFFPFGLGISTSDIAEILTILVIGALSIRRFLHHQVRESLALQAQTKDLEQAQQLQQRVLVPDLIHSSAFAVESEYLPAQTVGGDFFQTLTRPDGSLLLVIGDVSGKGISAAMLVAVLVGAIRNRAEDSFDPASMLERLNRRMIGRSGGHFATCLAAEISPSGLLRIANAGHLPPYRNGHELDLPGSLPLGIDPDIQYPTHTLQLNPGDRLTFITDGVIEATNPARELFGFDRTRNISTQPAFAIAHQVQTFGQEDDITVLGVAFSPA